MAEQMTFLPRARVLTLEEMATLCRAFVELGVEKIRLTGAGLVKHARALRDGGLTRLNISLDTLDPGRFRALTRTGELARVLDGIRAARDAGFEGIKLNAVILKGRNDGEVLDLVAFARAEKVDISFIEEMPLGQVTGHDRAETFCSSDAVRATIETRHALVPTTESTLGPSRYFRMPDSESRIGFISPHSHNFCDACNRVRVTAEGRLLLCLGNEHSLDLRSLMRRHPGDRERLKAAIVAAMTRKPERHHFTTDGEVQVVRFMSMTGG